MKKIFTNLIILIASLCIISCSNSEDSSVATSQLSQVLDQPNSTDGRHNIDLPDIIIDSCYLIDSSTIDNSTVNTSSISDNSSIKDSIVSNCSAVVRSIVDNSSNVDNSTITDSKINSSFVCAQSTIDNSTIENSTVCSSTVSGGSFVSNNAKICNSTIDNSTVDNATICNSIFSGGIFHNVNISDSDRPTVLSVSSDNSSATYAQGSIISITVAFNESVFVDNSSAPRIELETGSTDRYANYVSGNSSNILKFLYTVQSGDCSIDNGTHSFDYKATNSLSTIRNSISTGTIKDNSTNEATYTLPSPGGSGSLDANKDIIIEYASNKC